MVLGMPTCQSISVRSSGQFSRCLRECFHSLVLSPQEHEYKLRLLSPKETDFSPVGIFLTRALAYIECGLQRVLLKMLSFVLAAEAGHVGAEAKSLLESQPITLGRRSAPRMPPLQGAMNDEILITEEKKAGKGVDIRVCQRESSKRLVFVKPKIFYETFCADDLAVAILGQRALARLPEDETRARLHKDSHHAEHCSRVRPTRSWPRSLSFFLLGTPRDAPQTLLCSPDARQWL